MDWIGSLLLLDRQGILIYFVLRRQCRRGGRSARRRGRASRGVALEGWRFYGFWGHLLVFELQNLDVHSTSSAILICMVLSSPVVFLFLLVAVVVAMTSEQLAAKRHAVGTINLFGALVALYFAIILIGFMRNGPINPG
ncbi:MAG: hypothetical protein ACOX9C_03565 [Kiritimatiellia bacterium]|jgi:hypothetical protein